MPDAAVEATEEDLDQNVQAPAPPPASQNGHAQTTVKPGQYDTVVTQTARQVIPRQALLGGQDPLMTAVNRRAPYRETEKTKSDRAFLEDLQTRPEAGDFVLIPHRQLPRAKKDGAPLKQGKLFRTGGEISTFELMSLDPFVEELTKAWGGGQYRCVVCYRNGTPVPDMQVIMIQIPSDQYPAKGEEYEETETPAKNTTSTAIPEKNERLQRLKEIREEEAIEEAESKAELSSMSRRLKHLQTTREISELTKRMSGGADDEQDSRFAAMERRLEQEKRDRDAQLEKIEQRHREDLRRIEDEKKEIERKAEKQKEDLERRIEEEKRRAEDERRRASEQKPNDTLEKIIAVMAPIAVAMIQRPHPPAPLPPPAPPDHTPMMIEMQRSMATVLSASLARPKDDSGDKTLDAIVKLTNKDNSSRDAMISGLMQAFVSKDRGQSVGPETYRELIEFGATLAGGGQGPQAEHGDDYNPALGFLGNTGKSLFKALQTLIESAATSPQILELVKAVVGTRKPTQEQLLQAAYRYEQSGQLPPAVQNRLTGPQFMPQFAPQPAASQQFAPQPAAKPNQPTAPVASADEVVDELEGAASGLPTNGEPADSEATSEQLAEAHLNQTVTETIEQILIELAAKPAQMSWAEYGVEHINKPFLQRLVDQPSDGMRFQMISAHCHPTVWGKLRAALANNVPDQMLVQNELHRMIDMAKDMLMKQAAPAPAVAAPEAPAPAPAPVAPVVQPV